MMKMNLMVMKFFWAKDVEVEEGHGASSVDDEDPLPNKKKKLPTKWMDVVRTMMTSKNHCQKIKSIIQRAVTLSLKSLM